MMNDIKSRNLWKEENGFTLIEMMIVVAIIAILTAVAIPKFSESLAMANTARVQADLQSLDTAIAMYRVQNGRVPQTLTDLKSYIDVENIKAPTGDVYVNGTLESNTTDANYTLSNDKTNSSFLGHSRAEFGKAKTNDDSN